MKVQTAQAPGDPTVDVITVSGEIDMWTVEQLKDALTALEGKGAPRVVVDLLEVGFIDSTGIGVLVGAARTFRTSGGDLHLVVGKEQVSRVLEITGVDQVIPTHNSLKDAQAGIAQPAADLS